MSDEMRLNSLKPAPGAKRNAKRVGRGIGSGVGLAPIIRGPPGRCGRGRRSRCGYHRTVIAYVDSYSFPVSP